MTYSLMSRGQVSHRARWKMFGRSYYASMHTYLVEGFCREKSMKQEWLLYFFSSSGSIYQEKFYIFSTLSLTYFRTQSIQKGSLSPDLISVSCFNRIGNWWVPWSWSLSLSHAPPSMFYYMQLFTKKDQFSREVLLYKIKWFFVLWISNLMKV